MPRFEKRTQLAAGLAANGVAVGTNEVLVHKIACVLSVAAAATLLVESMGVNGLSKGNGVLGCPGNEEDHYD